MLKQKNLIIAKKKCDWAKREISYLGHHIGNGIIKPDDQKISIIKEWKRPTNIKETQHFLGFINYYSKFIKNFAAIARPGKIQSSHGNQNMIMLLLNLKKNYQELICPDVNKPFTVYTDASDNAIGSVLKHMTNDTLHTVSMRSRCLKGSELNSLLYMMLLCIGDITSMVINVPLLPIIILDTYFQTR